MIVIYHAHLITLFANEVYSCCVFTKMNLRVVVANTCVEHINQDNETNNT